MKLSDEKANFIVSELLSEIESAIGIATIASKSSEFLVTTIAEIMDDLEDRLDGAIATRVREAVPPIPLNSPWF